MPVTIRLLILLWVEYLVCGSNQTITIYKFTFVTKMKKIYFIVLILTLAVFPQQRLVNIGDFTTENGGIITNCQIGFRAFGIVNGDSSNVVLYLSWFGGTSEQLSRALGKDNLIDSTKYFVITIDALGNGISSSPSNYLGEFPDISIRDMVVSQKKMLEQIGIKKVHAIVGGSMGSMQVFEWLITYPSFMNKAVPYVSSPKLSTYDLLLMNWQKHIIETGWKHGASDIEIATSINMFTAAFGRTPEKVNEMIKIDSTEKYIGSMRRDLSKTFTIKNYYSQLKAMMTNDISRHFNNSFTDAANAIRADIHMIVSATDLLINPKTSMELAKLINCEITILENNCGHLAPGCELKRTSQIISEFLEN